MKVDLITDRLLIVALSQQRPDRDDRLRSHLYDQVRWYRQRLEVFNPYIASELHDGIRLYRPVTALLWGIYDQATFFIADDFEAVTQIAPGVGASSRDFLICSPYAVTTEPPKSITPTWPAHPLLNRTSETSYKYLAIATFRLASPVASAMGAAETRHAIVQRLVLFMNEVNTSGPCCFLSAYRCWSGPDLLVVFQANDPALFIKFEAQARSLSLRNLWPSNPLRALTKDQALPARILTTWHGNTRVVHDGAQSTSRFDRRSVLNALDDETWNRLGDIDAVCHLRIHLGVHGPGWSARASNSSRSIALGAAFSATDHTIQPQAFAPTPMADPVAIVRENLRKALISEVPTATEARATVSLEIKPGHLSRLMAAFRYLAETESEAGHLLRKLEKSLGAHPQLRITVPIAITEAGFEDLFLFSHGLRLLSEFCSHLLAIETRLSLSVLSLTQASGGDDSTPSPVDVVNGYRLLEPRNTVDVLHFHRRLISQRRLPRSQAMALHAVLEHLEEQFAQPHSADAVVGLRAFAINAVRNLLKSHPEQVPPHMVSELVEAIEIAAQQRAHYDASPKARVPLSGHLPYGLAQMVSIADGIVSTIFESGLVPWNDSTESTPTCRTLLLLKPSPAVEIREYRELGVATISTSLINLLSPMLLLTSIFHEAGHACALDISSSAERCARAGIATTLHDYKLVGDRERQDVDDWALLLQDVIPHAFLLILGCEGNFERFAEQFLFSNACGLQHFAGGSKDTKIDEWARTFCQLLVQSALHRWLHSPPPRTRDLRSIVHDVAKAELYDPQTIRQHIGWWAPDIEQETASGTTLADDLLALEVVFQQGFLSVLCAVAEESVANVLFWKSVEGELERIQKFRKPLSETHAVESGRVAHSVATGCVPQLSNDLPAGSVVGWNVVNHETGRPTIQALAFVREVFIGLQTRHEQLAGGTSEARQQLDRGVWRSGDSGAVHGVRVTRTRELVRPPRGIFSDPEGGPFVCGTNERAAYLATRVAALETLSCLASRVSSALLMDRFFDQRAYARHRFSISDRPTQCLWRARPLDTEHPCDCILVDICPGTVKVLVSSNIIEQWGVQIGSLLWIGEVEDADFVFCSDIRTVDKSDLVELVLMLPRTARLHGVVAVDAEGKKRSIRRYSRSGRSSGASLVRIAGLSCEVEDYSRVGLRAWHGNKWAVPPSPGDRVAVSLDPERDNVFLQVRWINESHIGLSWPEGEDGHLPHIAERLGEREPSPWTSGPIGAGSRIWLSSRRVR